MPRAYEVEGTYGRWLQNISTYAYVRQSISNALSIVSTKLSIFARKHQFTKILTDNTAFSFYSSL